MPETMSVEDELRIITEFLLTVGDADEATEHATVLEACRGAVESLGLAELYECFLRASDENAVWAISEDGKGIVQIDPD